MIGIDMSETARVNAVCSEGPLPGGVAPGPCVVTLAFEDISGRMLAGNTVTLQPGQGTSLDLRGMDLVRGAGRRVQVQPCVKPVGRGYVLVTAEVFDDATGRTALLLNPTQPSSLASPTAGQ
jgi:hypothetical protein